jgi:nitric oxide reductase NorD protein
VEAWIGERWHRWITRRADRSHAPQAVNLASVQQPVALLFRAAGGAGGVRVVPAALARTGGPRDWLQRLAGGGRRAPVTRLDGETLALPPQIAVFDDAALNRDLYLWLAALAAVHRPGDDWLLANQAATAEALRRCPGLRPRWSRLRDAHLAQRPKPDHLRGAAGAAESQVQAALRAGAGPVARIVEVGGAPVQPLDVAPVWVWLECLPPLPAEGASGVLPDARPAPRANVVTEASPERRRTRRAPKPSGRAPMLLPSRTESITTFGEHVPLDRGVDDEDDSQARHAADDMDQLSVQRGNGAPASRVKFDLDLPSASADDAPLGPALSLPEWDWKLQRLRPQHCQVLTLATRAAPPFVPPPGLRATARRLRRRLEVLRAAPRWRRACPDGDDLDLDAWVRHAGGGCSGTAAPVDPPVFARRVRGERSLATLLLADLSLSTETWVNNQARVIDVVRDALYVFGEALHGTGDAFAMLGFSSVRRQHVRLQHLKGFDEAWGRDAEARVGAIKPGYYTRMGAAIRAATLALAPRPERQRLLLILTDGKPNDLDQYEGRWGLEDTRHAVMEARESGLLPFCISIDAAAHAYLPHLFGARGWAQVQRPAELPARLATVYAQLTR